MPEIDDQVYNTDEFNKLVAEGTGLYTQQSASLPDPQLVVTGAEEYLRQSQAGEQFQEIQRSEQLRQSVLDTINLLETEGARAYKFTTDDQLLWQGVQFGSGSQSGADLTSAYIGVDAEDLPTMMQILIPIAKEAASTGRNTTIRWLLGTFSGDSSRNPEESIGDFNSLESTDPRLIIDSNSENEVKNILHQIAKDERWVDIEKKRISKHGRFDNDEIGNLPHLSGTTSKGTSPQIVITTSPTI